MLLLLGLGLASKETKIFLFLKCSKTYNCNILQYIAIYCNCIDGGGLKGIAIGMGGGR